MKLSLGAYIAANWGVVVLYVLATVATVAGVLFNRTTLERISYRLAAVGLIFHSVLIVVRWVEVGHGPYMAPSEVLSSDAWMVVACYFVFLKFYPRIRPTSLLAFPAAFLMLGLSLFYDPAVRTLPPTFRSVWLVIHIALYKISFATLVIGCVLSILFLLKKRWPEGRLQQLPEADTLDVYSYRFAGFGFIFWTIGLLAGSIWAYQSWGRFWGWDPTETWSLITCLMFAAYLHLRRFFQWRGTRAAVFFIGCFVLSALSLFVMATLKSSIHSDYFR